MANDRPWFVLVGGVNGAGKSTVSQDPNTLRFLTGEIGGELEIINPDKVTQSILQRDPSQPIHDANVAAARACEKRVDDLIRTSDHSFAIETVLSTDKYCERVLRARRMGFDVIFIYLALENVESSIRRVRHRVERGGHDVPEERIRSRWPKSRANVKWFWDHSTVSILLFNEEKFLRLGHRTPEAVTFCLNPPASTKELLKPLLPGW